MFDLLASLGPGETVALIIAVCVTVVMTAKHLFADADEFGGDSASALSAHELRQIVSQAVENATAPLEARIEELEEQKNRPSEQFLASSHGSQSGPAASHTSSAPARVRNE